MKKSKELCSLWNDEQELQTGNVKNSELHEFKGHPFRVEHDMQFHGYGNINTAHFCFKASAEASETAPIFSKDYVKYEDKYYVISEGHKSFLADKIADDDDYILTLASIAKELELRGLHETKIHLAVGIPLKWVKAQRESFKVDIGNGTMNIMYLNDRRSMENKSWTEKFGVNQCSIRIRNKVLDETGTNLMDDVIERFLRTGVPKVDEK